MNDALYETLPEELQNIYAKYCLPDDLSGLTMDSIILSDGNREKVNKFLIETEYKKKFVSHGLKPINRIIASGASGTGKTFLAKCLAANFGYELLSIDIANALSTGVAAVAISEIFKLGNHIGKAIIFLDECDAIARNREDKTVPEDPNVRRANNAIFQQLDRMNSDCIFYSATNLFKELDPAFVRRFNVSLFFGRPPLDDLQETIHKFMLPGFTLVDDMKKSIVDKIIWYARNYTGLSYDSIEDWVERAEKTAIINDTTEIKASEIYGYFMDAMRIKLSYNDRGKPYLYQE